MHMIYNFDTLFANIQYSIDKALPSTFLYIPMRINMNGKTIASTAPIDMKICVHLVVNKSLKNPIFHPFNK